MSAAVALRGVDKAFGDERVLDGFELDVAPGELVALVGPSGCGKSTILNLLAGLEQPDAGAVEVRGVDDGAAPRLGVVFQQPRLLDWLGVRHNVEIAVRAAGEPAERAEEILRDVGLGDHLDAFPTTLSGGQRQRAAVARAFAIRPELLLLDEPFSALDEFTARKLRLQLQALWTDRTVTGVLVTHNPLEAAFLADRIVVLGTGPARVIAEHRVTLPRPRSPEAPELFELHAAVVAGLV